LLQIGETIVRWVPILVVSLVAFRERPNEGLENESMHPLGPFGAIFLSKDDRAITQRVSLRPKESCDAPQAS